MTTSSATDLRETGSVYKFLEQSLTQKIREIGIMGLRSSLATGVLILGLCGLSSSGAISATASWQAKPASEMSVLLKKLSGSWSTDEAFLYGPLVKARAKGKGRFTIRSGPGGNSVIIDYSSVSPMGPYSGMRTIYWDAQNSAYQSFYCDSMQPTGCGEAGRGSWHGNDLVFTTTGPTGHEGPVMRSTFSFRDSASFVFTIDVVEGENTSRSLEITARKEKA